MFEKTIEDLVREHVIFSHGESNGWHSVYCEVCGDGEGRTKGPRGGWLFQDEMCFYHCFNCPAEGSFDPNREHPFGKDMRSILDAFNIPKDEYNAIAYSKKVFGDGQVRKPVPRKIDVKTIELPDFFCELSKCNHDNVIVQKAFNELKHRNIPPEGYKFYLSTGKTKGGPREQAVARALMDRLIIPYFDPAGNLIYYQARAFEKNVTKKYINADVPRSSVIYGMERLNTDTDVPLYVTEGFFDAYHLKGVALLENSVSAPQLEMLKRSRRKKVFVPDKKSDSAKVVDTFIKEGWYVSVPEIGSACRDIDDAIRRFGKLYTLQTVASNIHEASNGKILMGLDGFL
jgi:hypothetical protein